MLLLGTQADIFNKKVGKYRMLLYFGVIPAGAYTVALQLFVFTTV